jgi:hypothetical protein
MMTPIAATHNGTRQFNLGYGAPLTGGGQLSQPPVVFDATGAGIGAHNPASDIWSETHVIGATANAIVAGYCLWSTANPSSVTATCGGTSMTLLTSLQNWTTITGFPAGLWIFGLMKPATGSKTVSVTVVGGSTNQDGYLGSVSYSGVTAFGAGVTNDSTAGSATMSVGPVTFAANQMAFTIMSPATTVTDTISGFNGTTRQNQAWSSGVNFATLIGDTPGGQFDQSTFTFSATVTSAPWAALAVPLY